MYIFDTFPQQAHILLKGQNKSFSKETCKRIDHSFFLDFSKVHPKPRRHNTVICFIQIHAYTHGDT